MSLCTVWQHPIIGYTLCLSSCTNIGVQVSSAILYRHTKNISLVFLICAIEKICFFYIISFVNGSSYRSVEDGTSMRVSLLATNRWNVIHMWTLIQAIDKSYFLYFLQLATCHLITPNCLPILVKAAMPLSSCSRVCAALNCTRMRA